MLEKIELNHRGIEFYLQGGGGVMEHLVDKGEAVALTADANTGRLGDHRVESSATGRRARVAVITDTFNAMHREADQRTLTRALDAAR